jgi:gas vesicle protein
MKNPSGVLVAFIGGAIVGGVLGLLFAPESGEETRKKVVDFLDKKGIRLNKSELDDNVENNNNQKV